jgi:NADH-quinone oxidoreductase subunit L
VRELLWLVPILPLFGALVLALAGGLLPRRAAAAIGAGSVGGAWAISLIVLAGYFANGEHVFRQTLWHWFSVNGLRLPMGLYLDQLSLVMMSVVAFVGFLIHLYSTEFMAREDGYGRFFCYMNLFVASMQFLVLGDNFVTLYLGWEGVGLCSYLLIGFWYRDRANVVAGNKAFIITRIGDTSLAIAFFLLFARLGTLDIQGAMGRVGAMGSQAAIAGAALLVLGGAVGKSAQLPLQTWLPDAMAGPTPVSALIHAATMVTAGVYLIARTHALFAAAPAVMMAVAVIGAATALYGAMSALAQRDIKRVLAYSTISQIGYMFLALGVGAWAAAIFHFMTHAFFKALLFLSAGIVIQALGEEHDIHRMGGLLRRLPVAGWTFLAGAASLAALPLVTAGFYSKDAVLWATWASPSGSRVLWGVGLAAALITAVYSARVWLLVFLGPAQREVERRPGPLMQFVVIVQALFAIGAGLVGMPAALGGFNPFGRLLEGTFGRAPAAPLPYQGAFIIISSVAAIAGVLIALWAWARQWDEAFGRARPVPALRQFLFLGWGFDWLYDRALVRPYVVLARLDRGDVVDLLYAGLAGLAAGLHRALAWTQTGRVRNYATGLLLGALLVVAMLLFR